VKDDLIYFNEQAPKYFEPRWKEKCEILSNWPSAVLAQCDAEAEEQGFTDRELTYCPCYDAKKDTVYMLNQDK
jgi:hypothetical protein